MSFDTESVGLKLAFIYLEDRIKIIKWKLQGKKKKKWQMPLDHIFIELPPKYNGLTLERDFSITEI